MTVPFIFLLVVLALNFGPRGRVHYPASTTTQKLLSSLYTQEVLRAAAVAVAQHLSSPSRRAAHRSCWRENPIKIILPVDHGHQSRRLIQVTWLFLSHCLLRETRPLADERAQPSLGLQVNSSFLSSWDMLKYCNENKLRKKIPNGFGTHVGL